MHRARHLRALNQTVCPSFRVYGCLRLGFGQRAAAAKGRAQQARPVTQSVKPAEQVGVILPGAFALQTAHAVLVTLDQNDRDGCEPGRDDGSGHS